MRPVWSLPFGLLGIGTLWWSALHCSPRASAQPPNPPAHVAKPAQPALDIDWRQLPSRPRVWSRPIGNGEPLVSGDQILILEPTQRAVSALEPRQGTTRWTLEAPAGVTWAGPPSEARDPLLLAGRHANGQPVLSRISSSGKLLWHATLSEEEFLAGAELGTGLMLYEGSNCRQFLFDGETGKRTVPELLLLGSYHYKLTTRIEDLEASRQCVFSTRLQLLHRGLAILSGVSKIREAEGLMACAPGAVKKPRWSVLGGGFRPLRVDGDEAIFFRAYPKVALWRLNLQTGATLWQRELPDNCRDEYRERDVQLVRKAGVATSGLIQNCTQAQLIEMSSGKVLWTRPTGGALALLADVDPVDVGSRYPELSALLTTIERQDERKLRLFSSEGRFKEGPKLPADSDWVRPVPGGLVLEFRDRVAMLSHGGQLVWQMKGLVDDFFRRGDHFVVQIKGPGATPQVIIEIATGRAFIGSQSTSHPLGRMAAAPGLWIALVDKPRMLVALDLAESAK